MTTIPPLRFRILVVMLIVMAGTIVSADRVRLRSGKVVEGTLTGADRGPYDCCSRTAQEPIFASRTSPASTSRNANRRLRRRHRRRRAHRLP